MHLHFTTRLIELFVILSWRLPANTAYDALLSSPVTRSRAPDRAEKRRPRRAIKNRRPRTRVTVVAERRVFTFISEAGIIRDIGQTRGKICAIHAKLGMTNYSANYPDKLLFTQSADNLPVLADLGVAGKIKPLVFAPLVSVAIIGEHGRF